MSVAQTIATNIANVATAIRGQGHIEVSPVTCMLASTGGPMAVFANSANNPSVPGPQLTDSETITVRWNNAATTTGIARNFVLPIDVDTTAPVIANALVSKTGATVGDASTLTFGAFITKAGDLHDADADAGGATSAVQGDATAKTLTRLTRTIPATDVAASLTSGGPGNVFFSVKVTDGTLGTDDLCLHALWFTYTRKLSLS